MPASTPRSVLQHVAVIVAHTELFFTDTLWPGFLVPVLDEALHWFSARNRRFGAASAVPAH